MSSIFRSSNSILVPREKEQNEHRYSYLSPSGRTSSSLLRTGTARRQRGQKRALASNWSYAAGGPCAGRGRRNGGFFMASFGRDDVHIHFHVKGLGIGA